jgi:ATP-dependent protease ClpP protease subunit
VRGQTVKKRFFADAIARDKERFFGKIVNRKGKHSAQIRHAIRAEFFVSVHDCFRVGIGFEFVSAGF